MDGLPERELRLLEEKWQELIVNQAKLSQNSELIFAKESSHSIHLDRPEVIVHSLNSIINKL